MAGEVQQYDFALTNQLVELILPYVADADRISLQSVLETVSKPGGVVSVESDTGDDLGCGIVPTVATDFFYVPNSFRAVVVKAGYWAINVTLRYIA